MKLDRCAETQSKEQPARVHILGMPLDVVTIDETLDHLVRLARGDRAAYVVTANVDHVLRYRRCPDLRPLYSQADLVVADGTPLVWASKLLGKRLPERVAGSDLFPALCQRAAEADLSVYFLGGAPGSAIAAADVLQKRHPRLRVVGTYCPDYGFERDSGECTRIVDHIRQAGPDILFVGLGSPKQEQWIDAYREACGVKLSMGIGISFSFVCGHVTRAPRWIQRLGLEWAHRLVQEPRRLWKRYLVVDAAFVFLVVRELFFRGPESVSLPAALDEQLGKRP